jgi:hypothetical protein
MGDDDMSKKKVIKRVGAVQRPPIALVNLITTSKFVVGQGFKVGDKTFKIVEVAKKVMLTPRDRDTSGSIVQLVTAHCGRDMVQFHSYAPISTMACAPRIKGEK